MKRLEPEFSVRLKGVSAIRGSTVIFKFYNYIYLQYSEGSILSEVGRIVKLAVTILVMKQYALLSDIVSIWTKIFHCIK